MSGRVVLVDTGPGDPDLITVARLKALREADVIVTDRLVPRILLAEAGEGAEIIPVGKIPRGKFTPQERINEILTEQALAGRIVVRFKGGDPFVFGRGYEEWLACVAAGVPVNYVPGVSSPIVGAGLAEIPVTQRGITRGYAVVNGHVPPGGERCDVDQEGLAGSGLTPVIMMGVFYLPRITECLIEAGLDPQTPPAMVENAGLPQMWVLRSAVGKIAEITKTEGVCPPAVTIIGEVAGLGI